MTTSGEAAHPFRMPLSQTYNPTPYYGGRAGAGGVGRAPTPWAPYGVDSRGAKLPEYYEYNGRKYRTEGEMQDARSIDLQQRADATGQSIGSSWGENFYPRSQAGGNRYASAGGGTGTAGGGTGTVDFASALNEIPGGDEPWINAPTEEEDRAALAASYGRAKERAGGEALGAAKSIRALMARRGLGGSRFATSQEAGAITGGQQNLANFNRDEAMGFAKRRQNVADMGYQGGIAQRGQNIGSRQQRTSHALSLAALKAR